MSIIAWVVVMTMIAGVGGTGIGGIIRAVLKKNSQKTVSLLLSFAGGVMLSIVCFDLVSDALTADIGKSSLWLSIVGILAGYIVIYILNYFIDKATNHEIIHIDKDHPKTTDDLDELIHADHYEEHKKRTPRTICSSEEL